MAPLCGFNDAVGDHFTDNFWLADIMEQFDRHVVGFTEHLDGFRAERVGRPNELQDLAHCADLKETQRHKKSRPSSIAQCACRSLGSVDTFARPVGKSAPGIIVPKRTICNQKGPLGNFKSDRAGRKRVARKFLAGTLAGLGARKLPWTSACRSRASILQPSRAHLSLTSH